MIFGAQYSHKSCSLDLQSKLSLRVSQPAMRRQLHRDNKRAKGVSQLLQGFL